MVNFADAISKMTISGKTIKDIPNSYKVRHIMTKNMPLPELSQATKLRTEVNINSGTVSMSAAELAGRYHSQLDTCGEWAPWSKIGQHLSKK